MQPLDHSSSLLIMLNLFFSFLMPASARTMAPRSPKNSLIPRGANDGFLGPNWSIYMRKETQSLSVPFAIGAEILIGFYEDVCSPAVSHTSES